MKGLSRDSSTCPTGGAGRAVLSGQAAAGHWAAAPLTAAGPLPARLCFQDHPRWRVCLPRSQEKSGVWEKAAPGATGGERGRAGVESGSLGVSERPLLRSEGSGVSSSADVSPRGGQQATRTVSTQKVIGGAFGISTNAGWIPRTLSQPRSSQQDSRQIPWPVSSPQASQPHSQCAQPPWFFQSA